VPSAFAPRLVSARHPAAATVCAAIGGIASFQAITTTTTTTGTSQVRSGVSD
jgi:hypothetical protein